MGSAINEKKLFYQYLGREIDNFISNYCPMANFFSGTIKNYIFNTIDPYLDLFFMGGNQLNTDAVEEYAKTELTNKISDFMEKYKNERNS